MRVLFTPEVRKYFDEFEVILYEKGYFSFPVTLPTADLFCPQLTTTTNIIVSKYPVFTPMPF